MHNTSGRYSVLQLESCLFCGKEQVATIEIDNDSWMVECLACHATGPVLPTENVACLQWNQRLGHPEVDKSLRAKLFG